MKNKKYRFKRWKVICKKFGVDAWDEVEDFIWKMELKIEELTKSRDNWKLKYKLVREKSK